MNTLQLDPGHLHDHWYIPRTLLTDHHESVVAHHSRLLEDAVLRLRSDGVPARRITLQTSSNIKQHLIVQAMLSVAQRRSFWDWIRRRPRRFEPRYVVTTVYDVDEMMYRTTCEEADRGAVV